MNSIVKKDEKKPLPQTPAKKDDKKPVIQTPAKKDDKAKYINKDNNKLSHFLGTYVKEFSGDVDKMWNLFDVDKNNALDRAEALLFVKKLSEGIIDKTRK
jgi:hypothetical protein